MIELDLFGNLWGDFLNELKEEQIQDVGNDSILCFVSVKELEKIPENYKRQKFAGRISFPDEHMWMMKGIFQDLGVSDEYIVSSGYFPLHIESN